MRIPCGGGSRSFGEFIQPHQSLGDMTSSSSLPEQRRLQLPSEHESVQRVVQEAKILAEAHLQEDEDLAHRFVLLVSEAVDNAIRHGNRYDASKQVHVSLRITNGEAIIEVEDEGSGFDPASSMQDPRDPEHLTESGGRGLFLIRELADEVQFEKDGSRLRLTLARAGTEKS